MNTTNRQLEDTLFYALCDMASFGGSEVLATRGYWVRQDLGRRGDAAMLDLRYGRPGEGHAAARAILAEIDARRAAWQDASPGC